jgi:hypothetical protein
MNIPLEAWVIIYVWGLLFGGIICLVLIAYITDKITKWWHRK